jgi:hypothetical protein
MDNRPHVGRNDTGQTTEGNGTNSAEIVHNYTLSGKVRYKRAKTRHLTGISANGNKLLKSILINTP